MSSVKGIAVTLVQRLSLRTTGGDLLRQAITTYIDQCAKAQFPAHEEGIVDLWQAILGKPGLTKAHARPFDAIVPAKSLPAYTLTP